MKKALGGIAAVVLGLAAWGLYEVSKPPKYEKRPPEAAQDMEFPQGLGDIHGRPGDGIVCHQVIKRIKGKPDEVVRFHEMPYDFRQATEEQKRAWVIEDTINDVKEIGMVCAPTPDAGFLGVAYAQPHCQDCGGGCGSISCPATRVAMGCHLGGTDCIITIICCGGPCTCA